MTHPFQELSAEYESWVAHCRPLSGRIAEIDRVALRLTAPSALARLGRVFDATKIPVVVQATIGERECGFDFTKNWGQGDALTRPSVHVPKGRPPLGAPPNDRFPVTWEFAAIDAFTVCDRLDVISVPSWCLAYACFKWEGYNGFGYRAHGLRTPYVLGGTNLQQPGKYTADGIFKTTNPDGSPLFDAQLGCLPIALRMIEFVPGLSLGDAVATIDPPPTAAATLPIGVGGSLTGTKWIQSAANLIVPRDPPLLVDGSFGRKTRAAVRDLETMFGLPVNGVVDDQLCNVIDARLAAMKPTA